MTYQECLEYMYAQLPMYQRSGAIAYKENLDNTERLLHSLGNPENKFRSIHIAGTNGKGSSAGMLASILQSAGYKVGLFTSPHLKDFSERIRVNKVPISEEDVIAFLERIKVQIERIQPSFFEMNVAMAFWYFERQAIDIAVVETGLGGRLDSTNVLKPEVALITKIGLDHTAILGGTLEAIAQEKAGIIKSGTPLVIGAHQPGILPVFQRFARDKGALMIHDRGEYSWSAKTSSLEGQRIDLYKGGALLFKDLVIGSLAEYVLDNLPGVLGVIQSLKSNSWQISDDHIREGLAKLQLKGRMQLLGKEPVVLADISHNVQGLATLFEQIKSMPKENCFVIFGMVRDKSINDVLEILPKEATYYFVQKSASKVG